MMYVATDVITFGLHMLIKCAWCENMIKDHEGKVMASKPVDVWEKFLICVDCYAPIDDSVNRRYV
jgi:hypothetical protein